MSAMMMEDSGELLSRSGRSSSYSRNYRRSFSRLLRENSVKSRFSPLDKSCSPRNEDYKLYRYGDYSRKRQFFVRSFQFTIKRTCGQKFRVSLGKVRWVLWKIMTLRYCERLASGFKRFRCVGNPCGGL
ncbi:hypothetical protein SUGI_0343090 [Cryptomeria japonica]|nr:hypothetical protein SUGI_0343090 [Cryptomeria japonica]